LRSKTKKNKLQNTEIIHRHNCLYAADDEYDQPGSAVFTYQLYLVLDGSSLFFSLFHPFRVRTPSMLLHY